MAKSAKNRRRLLSRKFRSTPYPTSSSYFSNSCEPCNLKRPIVSETKDWEESTCSVCMEFPHNAILLLCSSHDNGCRPYMCGTSHRHSNCLERFKKASTKLRCTNYDSMGDNTISLFELSCPLCRGQVKGWTVVESARRYLNDKTRSCIQDDCSFVGTYKELKKHVKSDHPCAKPREIDPEMEEKWRALQLESERQDVISTIMSSVPRSVVFGDYVIEMANSAGEDEVGDEDRFRLNRNIFSVLREGARLVRLQWDNAMQGIGGFDAPVNGIGGVSDVVTAGGQWRGVDVSRAERRNRRRRRSRGPSRLDAS
ncbi:uncharacterized protein LOC110021375 [Phalaenopsis equestris]|uniref:uncharacterized protein LOC110021375 n=1 Tax=Phalaenopsis equestris TaxID=78828 RepID=UPI0009E5BFD2|nr:uncharacterized protein LOC110021375 [Phalaenopsis equestris]XP_020575505.1 uncharacterized protein LOC110021375 [Phalaenopsis equestris]XP_020575506.1 uncharacterized protein LOC110021375 [Phalaenopsis equestris]XP_020575507.1 uncharacterized protein LOC110021375 [Phalaenopsis equestris]XP_020575508.1 uncharacterized protein LOC110021375 [Phalaenopsis equestris]